MDTPILVIDDDGEVQPTRIKEQRLPSNQAISQFTKQPEPIREPQVVEAPLIEINQKPDEKQIRLINIKRNLDIAAQIESNLMDQTRTLSMRSVEKQPSLITQNQLQDDAQFQEMSSGNSRKSTALLRNMAMSPQQINDVDRISLKRSQNVSTVDPRIIEAYQINSTQPRSLIRINIHRLIKITLNKNYLGNLQKATITNRDSYSYLSKTHNGNYGNQKYVLASLPNQNKPANTYSSSHKRNAVTYSYKGFKFVTTSTINYT